MDPKYFYRERRRALEKLLPGSVVLLHNTRQRLRTAASVYPFRPNSNCLFFAGPLPPGALALIRGGELTVFLSERSRDDAVWDGSDNSVERLNLLGVDRIRSKAALTSEIGDPSKILSLSTLDPNANAELGTLLGRPPDASGRDRELALAVIELRIVHDELGIAGLTRAVELTELAFQSAMRGTAPGVSGRELLFAVEAIGLLNGATAAFSPIITVQAEVLHSTEIAGTLNTGELVLVDFGVEVESGYAADVTRTWAVSGDYNPEQRAAYELVLETQQAAIDAVRPGVLYGDIHLAACRVFTQGLIALGVLKGNVESLVERGAHTLFFPHGIGHLLGLDVHDMEDLGDLAGYADGQVRDPRFGFNFLRLNRRLRSGMCVTIEPGFYLIPALLRDRQVLEQYKDCLDMEKAARFRSVRGIRIEDDVLVEDNGARVLTKGIPKTIEELSAVVGK